MSTLNQLEIRPPADETELRAFRRLLAYAFADSPAVEVNIEGLISQGIENLIVARVEGQIVGGLGIIPMGQWFGGRSVPMAGINRVTIAPEYRSTGIASAILRRMLGKLDADGTALSVLYPATQPVYRRVGYEQAGVAIGYKQPTHALVPGLRDLRVRPLGTDEGNLLRELYSERARRTGGNLDRSEWMWTRVVESKDTILNTYVAERDGRPEGYVVYSQGQRAGEQERNIEVRDFVVLSPGAGKALLSFFADHRSVVDNITWMGSPADPLLYSVPNQAYKITWYEQWMLRLVNVRRALEGRGYWTATDVELHLDVRDDVLDSNNRRLLLRVSGGRGEVSDGGEGKVWMDVRGLAALYSGYLSPRELLSTGYIRANDETDLHALAAVFSGPMPWMPDGF